MSDDPLVGTLLGQYRIESVLGKGGMATVYQSTQVAFNRTVAIKVLPSSFMHDETFMTRFRQEAEVAAQLEHIHILPVYDYGEHDGVPFIVMRYLDGGTLRDLTQSGPLEPDLAVRITSQVAQALDYAHTKEVIHRDLKPSNIMLDANDNAFLTDFGTAKLRDRSAQLTGSGIVGTPAYMAPEQSMPGPLTPSVDIYALGVTLFEMVTGQVPYSADTPIVQILMHIQHPVPSLLEINPAMPRSVDAVVKRAMAKRPEDRYETAQELANALTNAVRDSGGWTADDDVLEEGRRARHAGSVVQEKEYPTNSTEEREGGASTSSSPPDSRRLGFDDSPIISPVDEREYDSYEITGPEGFGDYQELESETPADLSSGLRSNDTPVLVTQDGSSFNLSTSNTLIGRSDERKGIFVDIELTQLDHKKRSSRSHARILERDGDYVVWDLHSMNGTYVNGQRLPEGGRTDLQDGDVLQFGKDGVTMVFQR